MISKDLLRVAGLCAGYGDNQVVSDIDLEVASGEIVAILGPSGCGKSTLLRSLVGLHQPSRGTVHLDGQDITNMAVHQRQLGLMSQNGHLFPHLTVAQNVAFGLEMQAAHAGSTADRVSSLLDLVSLSEFGPRTIDTLSGGQAQRVALARTLAPRPNLVLLDEPLSGLDRALRDELAHEMIGSLRHEGTAAIMVTHDPDEAFTVADRVAIMNNGRLVSIASPDVLRSNPGTSFVARFLGLDAVVEVDFYHGSAMLAGKPLPIGLGGDGRQAVLVPTKAVKVSLDPTSGGCPGTVLRSRFLGDRYQVAVRLGSSHGTAQVETLFAAVDEPLQPGQRVTVAVDSSLVLGLDG